MTAPVMERPTGRHPLAADLDRLRGMSDYLGAELHRPPGGWISLGRLIEDRRLLDDALKRNALAYKGTRRIAANFVAGGVTWASASVPLALMVIERRAITPDPDITFLRIDERGEVKGAFYDGPEFCVLPGDPAAFHEQAVLVDDVAAMHERVRTRLISSLGPLVEVLSDLAGLSRRGLWGQIASGWGSVIVWAAQLAGRGSAGIAEAEAFLRGSGPAFGNPPTFYRIQHRGQELVATRRGVCCLAYKLSDFPYCGSCPLISDDERHQRYCDEADGKESSPDASQASTDTDHDEELPMTGRRLLERSILSLVALIALPATSCGGRESRSPASTAGDTLATRIVEHAMGETEVPVEPQRVVVLDTGELDSATALDVAPVGGVTALSDLPVLEYLQSAAEDMEVVGTIEEPDLEAVAALEPDLILSSKLRHEKIYVELSQIAPSVFTETVGVVWKENFLIHAEALSKNDEAKDMLAAYEERAAELGERITETLGGDKPTVSAVRFLPGETRIYLSESFIGTILEDVGLPRPKAQRKNDFALYPSEEQIGLMDGDLLFYTHYGPEGETTLPKITGNPLWQELDAIEGNRTYEVPEDHWMLGIGIQAADLVLDDLESVLL